MARDRDGVADFVISVPFPEGAKIKVVGVGGGGCNALNSMIEKGIKGVDFIAINTDVQHLEVSRAPVKLQIGRRCTRGLGAGSRPEVGREAALESAEEIAAVLQGADMVFLATGMGGGTGTGATPVVARIARQLDILTVAVVTIPYHNEGPGRMRKALAGIEELRSEVDTLIVIPNQRLLTLAEEQQSLDIMQAFQLANEVLYNAVRGIAEVITVTGVVNLDFADVNTVLRNSGSALIGSASASGADRARKAVTEALHHPMMDGRSIAGAQYILVNITSGGAPLTMELRDILDILFEEGGESVEEVLHGIIIDPDMDPQELRVTVLACGFPEPISYMNQLPATYFNKKPSPTATHPADPPAQPTSTQRHPGPRFSNGGEDPTPGRDPSPSRSDSSGSQAASFWKRIMD